MSILFLDDDTLLLALSHLVEPSDLALAAVCCRQLRRLVSNIAHRRLTALQTQYPFDEQEWRLSRPVDHLIPEYVELSGRRDLLAPPEMMRELLAYGAFRLPGPVELRLKPYHPGTDCLRPFTPWNARSLKAREMAGCRIPWQDGGLARQRALGLGDNYARINNGELQFLCHETDQLETMEHNILDRGAMWVKIPFPLTCEWNPPVQFVDVASFEAHCRTWRRRENMANARGDGRLDDRYADPRDRDPPVRPGGMNWAACTPLEKYSRLRTYVEAVRGAIKAKLAPATWNQAERQAMSDLASRFESHMRDDDTLEIVMEIRDMTRESALELLEKHLPDCTPEACGRVTLGFALEDFEREGITHIVRAVLIDGLESVEPAASSGSSIAFMCCLSRFYEGYG